MIDYLRHQIGNAGGQLGVTLTLDGQNAGGHGQLLFVDETGIVMDFGGQVRCHPWSSVVRLKLD